MKLEKDRCRRREVQKLKLCARHNFNLGNWPQFTTDLENHFSNPVLPDQVTLDDIDNEEDESNDGDEVILIKDTREVKEDIAGQKLLS